MTNVQFLGELRNETNLESFQKDVILITKKE